MVYSPVSLYYALSLAYLGSGGEGHMGQVVFQVPKFTADSRCDVKTMMEKMGIKGIFETGDFSQMTEEHGITISSITQDGHIFLSMNKGWRHLHLQILIMREPQFRTEGRI